MKKGFTIGFFPVCFLMVFGCSNVNSLPVIRFSADSSAFIVANISKADLLQLKTLLRNDSNINNYFAVSAMPQTGDTLQIEQNVSGKLKVLGDSVLFTPLNKFKPGKSYIVKSFIGVKFASVGSFLTRKAKTTLTPQQKILVR